MSKPDIWTRTLNPNNKLPRPFAFHLMISTSKAPKVPKRGDLHQQCLLGPSLLPDVHRTQLSPTRPKMPNQQTLPATDEKLAQKSAPPTPLKLCQPHFAPQPVCSDRPHGRTSGSPVRRAASRAVPDVAISVVLRRPPRQRASWPNPQAST